MTLIRSVASTLTGLCLLILLIGCQTLGPKAVTVGRGKYDFALQDTDKQSLFRNIVRLRYNDSPYFLEVTNIFSAPVFETSAGGGIAGIGKSDIVSLDAGVSYTESPVIVYAPVVGEKYSRNLLTPISFKTISLLANVGWNLDQVWRLCFQSMNDVTNAETAAGPTPSQAPEFEKFQSITQTFERLNREGTLDMGLVADGKSEDNGKDTDGEIVFSIDSSVRNRPDVKQLFQDLELDPSAKTYRIVNAVSGGGGDTIAVVTRPVMGIMFFLSQAVQVPERDKELKAVTITKKDGRQFDWQRVTYGLMNIKSSNLKPDNAYVSIEYRGNWYYISDDDVNSKQTFFLLKTLLSIQAGVEVKSAPTLLTLPIR